MGFFNSKNDYFSAHERLLKNSGVVPSTGYEKCENCSLSRAISNPPKNHSGIACTDRGDPEMMTFANFTCEFFKR
jgi:hypothetical protein